VRKVKRSRGRDHSRCVLSDLALFFLKIFFVHFPPSFLTLKRLGFRVREGFGDRFKL
jgi:hypothetical protein